MIRALILEDERKSRELLSAMLSNYCEGVDVIGTGSNIEEGEALIGQLKPQLVFMDIMLGGKTAFELLDKAKARNYEVVFTTAHEKYAIKAVKYSGLDYLLKPISLEELRQTITRVSDRIRQQGRTANSEQKTPDDQLVVPTSQGYMMLDVLNIVFLAADGAYTRIFLREGSEVLISNSIGTLQNRLCFPDFIRIHRSWVVHRRFIQEYVNGRGGYVLLKSGHHLSVSARRKAELLKALGL